MSGLLFDDDDFEEVIDESLAWSRKLVVREPCTDPEDLIVMEQQYRMSFKPPILFEDDGEDGRPIVGNPGTMAKAIGVDAAALTLEMADRWLDAQWLTR